MTFYYKFTFYYINYSTKYTQRVSYFLYNTPGRVIIFLLNIIVALVLSRRSEETKKKLMAGDREREREGVGDGGVCEAECEAPGDAARGQKRRRIWCR